MRCPSCDIENPDKAKFCNECGARLDAPAGQSSSLNFASSADFVGRHREMSELISALDDAFSGQGRLVMLVGEPGIGKTRMAQELATIGEQRGFQVLWGRCHEQQGAPSFWP